MDHYKPLYESLLKADNIDPAKITDPERAMLGQMLEKEKKRRNRLSRLNVGILWGFAAALAGLCLSERVLDALHIPFVAAFLAVVAGMWILVLTVIRKQNRKIRESGRRIGRLEFLVSGRRKGLLLVGKKDGRKVILWPHVLLLTAVLWLFFLLGGGGVYSLLRGQWDFFSDVSLFMSTLMSIGFMFMIIRESLKTPLDQLTELNENTNPPGPS